MAYCHARVDTFVFLLECSLTGVCMSNEPLTTHQLKNLVRDVVLVQGNAFIKDLLRQNHTRIGSTKDEFTANLNDAIDTGGLTQEKLHAWLEEVEGWGNQHVYLFEPPSTQDITDIINASPLARYLDAPTSLDFPDQLELKTVKASGRVLSIVWHQRKEGWNRWAARDVHKVEGLDRVWLQAYRQRLDRSVVRFEWRYDEPYCAIFIQRSPDIAHKEVIASIESMLCDICVMATPFKRINLMRAIHVSSRRVNGVQSTRFELDSGYVEIAATTPGGGIDSVEPVRLVLQSVDTSQFDRAHGMLNFAAEEHGTSRSLSVEVFGDEAKLRIWAQCKRDDVLRILSLIWEFNEAS